MINLQPVNTKKIIYIAGYGYSGSTLLERILATHPQIVGCGEVHNLLNDFAIKETCSCGSAVDNCVLWKQSYAQYRKDITPLDSFNVFPLLSLNSLDEIVYFCDASKTTWGTMLRPYTLSKEYDVFLIHLSRNGIACLNSILKRKGNTKAVFKALATGIHWSIANLMAYGFQITQSDRYYRIKYEDLIKNPASSTNELFQFLELDAKSIGQNLADKASIPLTHQLSGNAIRRKANLVLQQTSAPSKAIGFVSKMVFDIVSWPIRKLVGY